MQTFLLENIKIHSPQNIEEMQNVLFDMLTNCMYSGGGCSKPHVISFINPEIFLKQNHRGDKSGLHKYFLETDYNFLDGIGIVYAINFRLGTFYDIKNRYPGTDFFKYLPSLEQLGNKKIRIFLYGSYLERNLKASQLLAAKYDNIEIVGNQDGYSKVSDDEIIRRINASNADILIVCKGCPMQELWIQKNLSKLKVKIVFGNGGSIDFWSESVKRAPEFLINHGFEWLFRLTQDFSFRRIRRILKLLRFYLNYTFGRYNIIQLKEDNNENAITA